MVRDYRERTDASEDKDFPPLSPMSNNFPGFKIVRVEG
jgi:hypothetical protein